MLMFYLTLSIGVSFLCSMFEAVILSISRAYVASLSKSGHKRGKLLEKLKTDIDDSLSAILTLNTIAHTIGSAGVGAEILKLYGDAYLAIGSVILTILILVLSEIIPKTIGATYARQLAPTVALGIQFFIYITFPFVICFKALSKLLGSSKHGATITRDEVLFTAQIGRDGGEITDKEVLIIKNLLTFRRVLVRDVMTPRTVVFALEQQMSVQEVEAKHPTINFSRIPIFKEEIDNLVGIVTRYDISQAQRQKDSPTSLQEISKNIHIVHDTMKIGDVFDLFIERSEHLFGVVDEHGGLDGIITLEDTIETLLGVEITDEFDTVEDMREFAAKQWEKKREKKLKEK